MKWKIVVDSSANTLELPKSETPIAFERVPFYLQFDEESIIDRPDLEFSEIFKKIESSKKSGTACPSPAAYEEAFLDGDHVICITITSELSGSYNSAVNGREMVMEDDPNKRIFVLNSRSAGPELDVLIEKAVELIDEKETFDEVVEALEAYHQKTDVIFILQSVKNLVNNGRVSRTVGSLIGLLNLRLVGVRTPEGTIDLAHRTRGDARGIRKAMTEMVERGYNGGRAIIAEHDNVPYAEAFKKALLKKFPDADVDIRPGSGLTTFYAEEGGLIIGYEKE